MPLIQNRLAIAAPVGPIAGGQPAQAGADIAYTVAGTGEGEGAGMELLAFSPSDGGTVNTYPLPEAAGFPVGVSVGLDRRVVVATSAGQIYSFAPAG